MPGSHVLRLSGRIIALVHTSGACAFGAKSAENMREFRRKHCASSAAMALHTRRNLAQLPRQNRTLFAVHASRTRAFLHLFCASCARVRRKICSKNSRISTQTLRVIGGDGAAHAAQPRANFFARIARFPAERSHFCICVCTRRVHRELPEIPPPQKGSAHASNFHVLTLHL